MCLGCRVSDGIMCLVKRNPTPEQRETVAALLEASGRRRRGVPIRSSFLQRGTQGRPEPGALAAMLRAHDERGLDLYLLFRALASSPPWDTARDARVWARTLGLPTPADTGAAVVSRAWKRLDENYNLVSRGRRGRLAHITAVKEDGSRRKYKYPTGQGSDRYFKVPFDYWTSTDSWYVSLSFPGKAILMVAMSLRPPFVLPIEKAPKWYGISSDSTERGLHELMDAGLLARKLTVKQAPLAPKGITQEYHYTLSPPFARPISLQGRRLRAVS